MKTKAIVAIFGIVLILVLLLSSNLKVVRLARSEYCDNVKIGYQIDIPDECLKK